jgi:hypothetical protein
VFVEVLDVCGEFALEDDVVVEFALVGKRSDVGPGNLARGERKSRWMNRDEA